MRTTVKLTLSPAAVRRIARSKAGGVSAQARAISSNGDALGKLAVTAPKHVAGSVHRR